MQPSQTYSDQLSQPMVSKRKQAYEKLLLYAYESIKEKESFLKRAHAAGVFAEIPKSLPKLPKKDFLFKNVFLV